MDIHDVFLRDTIQCLQELSVVEVDVLPRRVKGQVCRFPGTQGFYPTPEILMNVVDDGGYGFCYGGGG